MCEGPICASGPPLLETLITIPAPLLSAHPSLWGSDSKLCLHSPYTLNIFSHSIFTPNSRRLSEIVPHPTSCWYIPPSMNISFGNPLMTNMFLLSRMALGRCAWHSFLLLSPWLLSMSELTHVWSVLKASTSFGDGTAWRAGLSVLTLTPDPWTAGCFHWAISLKRKDLSTPGLRERLFPWDSCVFRCHVSHTDDWTEDTWTFHCVCELELHDSPGGRLVWCSGRDDGF